MHDSRLSQVTIESFRLWVWCLGFPGAPAIGKLQLEEAELQTLYSSFMSNIRLFGMMLDNSASVGVYSVGG